MLRRIHSEFLCLFNEAEKTSNILWRLLRNNWTEVCVAESRQGSFNILGEICIEALGTILDLIAGTSNMRR